MELEKLYKRTKTGKIQQWNVEVDNSPYESKIIITQGQLLGKKQQYVEIITEGKQKRSVSEQAQFQAESLFRAKLDEGYKTAESVAVINILSALDNETYWTYKDFEGTLDECLQKALPVDSTDVNGILKPQLAIKDPKKIILPGLLQPKLNGVRCTTHCKFEKVNMMAGNAFHSIGEEAQIGDTAILVPHCLSREGKSYDFATKNIRLALRPFFEEYPEIILDGELYVHGDKLQNISGAVRKEEYIPERHDHLEYHIYDVANVDWPQSERWKFVAEEVCRFIGPYIKIVETYHIDDIADLYEKVEQFENDGYEGGIWRNPQGKYLYGKRSNDLIKIKKFQDAEYEIVGFNFGKRGIQDLKFVLKLENGNTFEAVPTGTVAEKAEYTKRLESGELIGKMGTVRFFEFTVKGTPFHGNFIDVRDYE